MRDQAWWDALVADDRRMLWHPYTSMIDPLPAYPVRRAEGVHIELADGRKVVDGMSSWWAAIHGYNVPELNAAAVAQLQDMAHVMFGGLTHAPAVELGRRLLRLVPEGLEHIFFADSGSVSVEVAIKMAIQYQQSLGRPERKKILGFLGGYHGDTAGAMALCDPVGGMHHLFQGVIPDHVFAPRPRIPYGAPWEPEEGARLHALIAENAHRLAAVFIEPIVQGAGGMWLYHPEYLRVIRRACDEHGLLFVVDEIATGFGRTGERWGVDHAQVVPDIMCIGKALTGGYMTLAATLATGQVARVMSQGEAGVIMHGPTFMANPLACAVANASVELFEKSDWRARVQTLEHILKRELYALREHSEVLDVRILGAIGVIETKKQIDVANVQRVFLSRGAWIRPFRNLMYVMPPFVTSESEAKTLTEALAAGLAWMKEGS